MGGCGPGRAGQHPAGRGGTGPPGPGRLRDGRAHRPEGHLRAGPQERAGWDGSGLPPVGSARTLQEPSQPLELVRGCRVQSPAPPPEGAALGARPGPCAVLRLQEPDRDCCLRHICPGSSQRALPLAASVPPQVQVTAQSSRCSPGAAQDTGPRPGSEAAAAHWPRGRLAPGLSPDGALGPQSAGRVGLPRASSPRKEERAARTFFPSCGSLKVTGRGRTHSHKRERRALLSALTSLQSDRRPHLHTRRRLRPRLGDRATGGRVLGAQWEPSCGKNGGWQADSPVLKCTETPRPRAGKEGPP